MIERDVADGDEVGCCHGAIVSTQWLAFPLRASGADPWHGEWDGDEHD